MHPWVSEGVSFLLAGTSSGWFGVWCPAHCTLSIPVLLFVFTSGFGLGASAVLAFIYFRFHSTPAPVHPRPAEPLLQPASAGGLFAWERLATSSPPSVRPSNIWGWLLILLSQPWITSKTVRLRRQDLVGEDEPEVLGQLAAGILIRCGQRCHQLSFFCIPRGAESITPVRFYCVGLCSRVQGTEESLREGEPDEPGRLDCGQGPHWTAALPSRAQHPRLPCALWFTSSCVALALISPSGAALPLTTTRPCFPWFLTKHCTWTWFLPLVSPELKRIRNNYEAILRDIFELWRSSFLHIVGWFHFCCTSFAHVGVAFFPRLCFPQYCSCLPQDAWTITFSSSSWSQIRLITPVWAIWPMLRWLPVQTHAAVVLCNWHYTFLEFNFRAIAPLNCSHGDHVWYGNLSRSGSCPAFAMKACFSGFGVATVAEANFDWSRLVWWFDRCFGAGCFRLMPQWSSAIDILQPLLHCSHGDHVWYWNRSKSGHDAVRHLQVRPVFSSLVLQQWLKPNSMDRACFGFWPMLRCLLVQTHAAAVLCNGH